MRLGGDNRTRSVAEFVARANAAGLPPVVDAAVGLHLLDTLAAAVACGDLEAARVARRYVQVRGGAPAATILATTLRTGVVDAAFAGAMTAHAAEINDFIPSVFVQPGPAVVATALAVGEAGGARLLEVRAAIAAGYEIAARIPAALGVGNLRRIGLANHGVGGCFGAAVTAARLLGLSVEEVGHLLSVAAQQASGSWQWLLDVEHVEKAFVFAGLGARNGVEAALLVQAGYRGVPDVLDRPGTWFSAAPFAHTDGDGDLNRLVDGLGVRWCFDDVAFKRYPVGGPAQPAVDALLAMTVSIPATEVAEVVIEMPGRADAFRDAAMPALNLRYLASIILVDGALDFVAAQSLDRMHHDPRISALIDRVDVRHDPVQEAPLGSPRAESARVSITTTDGRIHERYVPHVVGFPTHPMSAADVENKARGLLTPHLGSGGADALIELCLRPGPTASAADLVAATARADLREPAVA